jgi:hypothetical protein
VTLVIIRNPRVGMTKLGMEWDCVLSASENLSVALVLCSFISAREKGLLPERGERVSGHTQHLLHVLFTDSTFHHVH